MLKRVYFFIVVTVSYTLFITTAYAVTEGGVDFPETIQLDDGTQLVLNGTGIRKKWFIKIYASGLYLPQKSMDVGSVLSMSGPKRIRMHFLYRKVEREKLLKTLDKGFKDNHSLEQLELFADKISQLKALFKTVRKNDEVLLSYTDSIGTQIYFNNELQGVIEGLDFHRAIFRVWLGDKPADKKLKQGLLGITE